MMLFAWLGLALAGVQEIPRPEVLDPRLELQLVAAEPRVVTPVACSVDGQGRLWTIESNTHFPPKNYSGHPTDRLLVLSDFGPDGRAGKVVAFADGFRYGMSLAHAPDGSVYFATRWEILRLLDTDGDGVCDERRLIAKLETKGDYPHNGLCGLAFDAKGDLWFGMGENLGLPYRLLGSDGKAVAGGGEGGNVFRGRADGSGIERVATGVWNPFHMTFDPLGRLFLVDNDPDSRPPCRLLHVVEGGDYGFKFRNGRKGLHPFTAWNGELPGTLPMVSGTGEAPSGMVHYAHPAFPEEYQGTLLATSWGDHLIQRFTLTAKGASFTATADSVVRGGDRFRPVGLAQAPDGSLFMTDWVDRSYTLHGKGRVWRLRAKRPGSLAAPSRLPPDTPELRRMNALLSGSAAAGAEAELKGADPFLYSAAVHALSLVDDPSRLRTLAADPDPRVRTGALLAFRKRGEAEALGPFLEDADPGVRRAAIQWAGEERLSAHAAAVERAAARLPVTKEIFEAFLATNDLFAGRSSSQVDQLGSEPLVVRILEDAAQPAPLRALALRMLRRDHPALAPSKVVPLLGRAEAELRLEAVRLLAARPEAEAQAPLRGLVADPLLGPDAVAGLSASTADAESRSVLLGLLDGPRAMDALRSLSGDLHRPEVMEAVRRIASTAGGPAREKAELLLKPRPAPLPPARWNEVAAGKGDAAEGERVFFHPKGPQCYRCHRIDGRGGEVGPDLSTIGHALDRARLVESILDPAREVAPMFVNYRLLLKNGDVLDGRLLGEELAGLVLIDAQARKTVVKPSDILEKHPSQLSIMPEKLETGLTETEFRDLIQFLAERK
jgi:putative membrane-bound dehydrogenase-like protein